MSKELVKSHRWNIEHLIGLGRDQKAIYELISSQRMHPVILLEGRQGVGKRHLAVWVAARLLCQRAINPDASIQPCGQCGSCKEVLAGIHADVAMLDGSNGPIRTADAEELQEHFNILSYSGLRIGLIMNADKLTIEAANRLLKTLEEPSRQAIIILTSSRPLSLPSTVLGRCLRWRVQAPDRSDVIGWTTRLLRAGGHREIKESEIIRFVQRMGFSPGRIYRAVEQDEDFSDEIAADVRKLLCASSQGEVLEAAAYLARTKKAKLAEVLDCAELELSTIYREQLSKEDLDTEKLREWSATRRGLREALSTARRQAVIGKISLNSQLVMESMGLSRWKESVI